MKGDINIMKFRMKKITALMAAAVLGASNGSRKYRSNGGSGRRSGNGG